MIAVGFLVLLFLATLVFFYTQWQRYQEACLSSSVEAAITDLGDGVFRSESARRYRDEIQVDLFSPLDRLTEQGRKVSATELESQWRDQLDERIDRLTREEAAEESLAALKRFQQVMSKLIQRLSQYGKLVGSEPPDD